jgi:23S rRNA (adenine2503-C2)-methyltransferase
MGLARILGPGWTHCKPSEQQSGDGGFIAHRSAATACFVSRALQGLLLEELSTELGSRTRALEAIKWLYAQRPVPTELPVALPGVSQKVWAPFRARTPLALPQVKERQAALDGTTKYALDFEGTLVETVRIPSEGRSTICVSSQAGCSRRCVFCATKELGFHRQLRAEEIVAQYLVARAEAPPEAPARNVVFMGMGEPFDNLDEVLRAVSVLTQAPAPQLKATSVTVSTSGVLPGMKRFLAESTASLALSLNATTDLQREALMPQNKTWPIAALLGELEEDAERNPRRDHFIEYVVFDSVNDSDADADRLVELLRRVRARVNLIPHNPFPGSPLKAPSDSRMRQFQQRVVAQGQLCMVRWPRGRQIAAACGQLVLATTARGFETQPS